MRRPSLSLEDLRAFAARYTASVGESAVTVPLPLIISGDVLKHFLGMQWVLDNVFEQAPLDSYIRFGSDDSIERYQYSDRIVALAEMLFHFQNIDGIDDRLEALSASSIETSVGELQGAEMLYTSGAEFRFNSPINRRGSDFDVTIELAGAHLINCEMKSKVSGTELSASTVTNSLQTARKQLPRSEPGLVFLKIPEAWVRQGDLAFVIKEALESFFRGTTRVAAVVLHWEEWYAGPGPLRARVSKFRVEYNASSPHAAAIRQLGLELGNEGLTRRPWTRFVSVLRG